MMKHGKCIISGYVAGQKFRPSNWAERVCEAGATFDPMKRIMRYSANLHPRQCDTHGSSIYVNFDALGTELAGYVRWFVESNEMEVVSLQPVQLQVIESPARPVEYAPRRRAA